MTWTWTGTEFIHLIYYEQEPVTLTWQNVNLKYWNGDIILSDMYKWLLNGFRVNCTFSWANSCLLDQMNFCLTKQHKRSNAILSVTLPFLDTSLVQGHDTFLSVIWFFFLFIVVAAILDPISEQKSQFKLLSTKPTIFL